MVVAGVILLISSGPNGPAGLEWFALPILGLVSVGIWLGVGVHSIVRRRFSRGLIIAPLIGLLTVGVVYNVNLSGVRFVLLDQPAFAAIVAEAPAPVVNLPDRDLTEDESHDTYGEFPGRCPAVIGTLAIRECATFAAGYLFYDVAGSGLIDDGGIAYLPAGAPRHDVGNGRSSHRPSTTSSDRGIRSPQVGDLVQGREIAVG